MSSYTKVFRRGVSRKQVVCGQGYARCTLVDQEEESSSTVCSGPIFPYAMISWVFRSSRLGCQLGLLDGCYCDVVRVEEV